MTDTVVYKMTGSGNDFVVLDGRSTASADWPAARIVQICDRRNGVGADGFVIVAPARPGAVRMAYWNADGSAAALCGNAALCIARLSVRLALVAPGTFCLLTGAGSVEAHCAPEGDQARIRLPDFDLSPASGGRVAGSEVGGIEVGGIELAAGERWMDLATVGVPHLVVRVDDVEAVDVLGRGRRLRYDASLGAAGANVNFVAPPARRGEPWLVRTYERGVEGETLACGTGTVAAGVILDARGEASLPVRFTSRGGGELQVRATLTEAHVSDVWLGGQGRLVFRAVWED